MSEECTRPLAGGIRVERAERHRIDAPGAIEGPIVIRQEVTIVNLSRSGCLIRGDVHLAIGEQICIRLPSVGSRMAHVRRVQDDSYGCSFDEFLRPSEVAAACAVPVPEDVTAVRQRIKDAIARGKAEEPREEKRGFSSRIRSTIGRLKRPGS